MMTRFAARWLVACLALVVWRGAMAEDDCTELDPAAEAAYFRAMGQLGEGDLEAALLALEYALSVDSCLHRVHLERGKILVHLGRLDEARSAAREFEGVMRIPDQERVELVALWAAIDTAQATQDQQTARGRKKRPEREPRVRTPRPTQGGAVALTGITGGYARTRDVLDVGDTEEVVTYDWGLVQARVDVRLVAGLHLRVQGGLAMSTGSDGNEENAGASLLYGRVLAKTGATYRFGNGVAVPYLDAHFLLSLFEDGRAVDTDGEILSADETGGTAYFSPGAGGGGGVELHLVRGGPVGLVLAPEVQIGWAGSWLFEAGASVRVAWGNRP